MILIISHTLLTSNHLRFHVQLRSCVTYPCRLLGLAQRVAKVKRTTGRSVVVDVRTEALVQASLQSQVRAGGGSSQSSAHTQGLCEATGCSGEACIQQRFARQVTCVWFNPSMRMYGEEVTKFNGFALGVSVDRLSRFLSPEKGGEINHFWFLSAHKVQSKNIHLILGQHVQDLCH